MAKHSVAVLLMLVCTVLSSCTWRWNISIKGEVVDVDGGALNGCMYIERGTSSGSERRSSRVDSVFLEKWMTNSPIRDLDKWIVEIDCGQEYEVYRTPTLLTFETMSIDLGTIVMHPKSSL